ncbi:hypothetical protein RRG08_003525 [Elysia crispata]|uniref:Uncharacterized protein n=1 Tax=Elysia crispata TaxID=231223 RepID=A0AAE1CTL1_9GAST|nr:hypothetical protein RRG08_003525 [Elysia crispata]
MIHAQPRTTVLFVLSDHAMAENNRDLSELDQFRCDPSVSATDLAIKPGWDRSDARMWLQVTARAWSTTRPYTSHKPNSSPVVSRQETPQVLTFLTDGSSKRSPQKFLLSVSTLVTATFYRGGGRFPLSGHTLNDPKNGGPKITDY